MRSRSILLVVLVVTLSSMMIVSPAASQPADNATDTVENATTPAADSSDDPDEDTNETDSLIYQFDGGGELVDVEYKDGATFVTLRATDDDQRFAVSEGDLDDTGSFEYRTISVDSDETRTVEIPVPKSSIVVTTTQDGFYYKGSSGPPIVINRPTESQLQLMGLVGVLGSIFAVGGSYGHLRRKHENTYKELFSDERKKIERNAFEGWRDRLIAWFRDRGDSKLSTVAGLGVLAYVGAVVAGQAPPPGDFWMSLSDPQRLIVAGTAATTLVGFFPMYFIVDKIYNPDRAFVADIDAADVYRAAGDDESGGLAIYSAPPEQVNDMDVDGALTRVPTPKKGGCYMVRGFDPESNTAAANPPTLSTDVECIAKANLIDENRRKLHQYEGIAQKLIAAFPSMQKHAQMNSVAQMDSNVRDLQSIGEYDDGLVGVMEDALDGTEFEGIYGDPDEGEIIDDEEEETDTEPEESDLQ